MSNQPRAAPWKGGCLYCRRASDARGVEHVYPEALGHHDWVLPPGAVCDGCNSGVLSKLDSAVAAHPHIAITLFAFDIPGKRRRLRRRHGYFEWHGDAIRIDTPRGRTEKVEFDAATNTVFVQAALPSEFRIDLFRRGLFKIALNFVASVDGMPAAVAPEYDRVRRYIRQPATKEELLPYVQRLPANSDPLGQDEVDAVNFRRYRDPHHDSVAMWLVGGEFIVDLLQPEVVGDLVRATAVEDRTKFLFHDAAGEVANWDGARLGPVDARALVARHR